MTTPNNAPITSDISIKAPLGEFMFANTFLNTITSKSDMFGDVYTSARASGKSIKIPKPARADVQGGRGVTRAGFTATPIVEEEVELIIDSWRGVQAQINTEDINTEFNTDLNGQVISPFTKDLSCNVESDALEEVNKLSNVIVASASTGVSFSDALDALAIVKENGIGERDIYCLASQRVHGGIVKSEGDSFNPQEAIGKMKFEGSVGKYAGLNWAVSENIPNWTAGTAADGAFDSATGIRPLGTVTLTAVDGVSTLAIESIGTNGTITAGSVIYIAGVNAIHPITRKDLGYKKGFNVVSTVTSSGGAVTVTLSEYFADGSGTNKDASLQNVTALPTTGAVVSIAGEVSSTYKQAVVYCKETFYYGMINLTKPEGGAFYAQDDLFGAKIRVVKDYDRDADANAYQIDNKSGYLTARPEWGVRMMQKIS